ncbi:uncharacterized protein LOC129610906 isoform X2 [Condylostylus longicornis]|uniref:uncharacterized protein LOC129610906 isoform X2 n=1 Tax=Condylostylus longicornis TaxID=2530218 RepID=UPI00244DBDAA|nr:uncharacterized protein LOC129610906 isoform X2 [Condylostylus longicornis]
MEESIKLVLLKLKELDDLALTCYEYYLIKDIENELLFNVDELYKVLESNFEKMLDENVLKKVLSILHYTISRSSITEEILLNGEKFFNRITNKYSKEEKCKSLIFELLHQYLVTILNSNRIYMKTLPNFNIINVYSDIKLVRQRSRICLELLVTICSNADMLIKMIDLDNVHFGEFFTHFIRIILKEDHFYKTENFWKICLHNLLHGNRKFAIYWLKVCIEELESSQPDDFIVPNFFILSKCEAKEIINSWYLFLTILESLDGKQSHLILPSLENLKKLKIFGIWNNFIICEIMKHTNTLVLKWAANFVLKHYTCKDFTCLDKYLDGLKSLSIVVGAFNNTFLYYGDDALQANDFTKFIEKDPLKFLLVLVDINWKSIPLFVLIQSLNILDKILIKNLESNGSIANLDFLLKLAGNVRRIENKIIRSEIRKNFFNIFTEQIETLKAENFFKLMELLFNDNEEKSENDIIFLERKIKQMNLENVSISFEFLKSLLVLHFRFDERTVSKIVRNILLNRCMNDILKILPSFNHCSQKDLIDVVKLKLLDYNNMKDIEFMLVYLEMCESTNVNFNIDDAYHFVLNDFNEIGRSDLKNHVNFCILKQNFVDLVAKGVFERSEEILVQAKKKAERQEIDETFIFDVKLDVDVEMLLSKGSFETINEFLQRKFLSKTFLCFDHKERKKCFNFQLHRLIFQEIFTNSKKNGFKHIEKALINLIQFILPEFPEVLNLILNIDQFNHEYYKVVFSTKLETVNLNAGLKKFFSSEKGFSILIRGLTFGEPLIGEPRIEYEYIIKNNLSGMPTSSLKIRLLTAKLTKHLICNIFSLQETIQLRDKLLVESENLNKKSRYFKNSKHHKLKLRIIQALALLSSFPNIPKNYIWTDRFLMCIFEENNQTDVTYIMELVIAKTISSSKLFNLLENCSNLRNSGIISLFAILFIHCFNYIKSNEIDLLNQIIKLILPWSMGQNFHIRLYAQITIYSLIKYFKLENYYFLSETILESLKQGTAEKNYKKLNYDFRFQEPNLEELLKLHVIYFAIPRLNHTDLDEWFDKDFQENNFNMFHEFYEKEIVKPQEELLIIQENVQRKINPLILNENGDPFLKKSTEVTKMVLCTYIHILHIYIYIHMHILFHCVCTQKVICYIHFFSKDTDMIVVASLIDKLPNLGGIARTCEVLGIKQLAISSLKYAETKEFKGLSMTAEKWLNLFELKTCNMQDFLVQMKSNGYDIVGAEQTANSENFVNFNFPKKTILLLGHEKEGIPANLIAFLDYAVEIPQFGMVRSLNVHVTGALFMWEYCKQHIIKK